MRRRVSAVNRVGMPSRLTPYYHLLPRHARTLAIQQKIDRDAVFYSSFVGAVKRLLVRPSFVLVGLSGAKQSVDRAFEKTTPTFHSAVSKFIATATPSTHGLVIACN